VLTNCPPYVLSLEGAGVDAGAGRACGVRDFGFFKGLKLANIFKSQKSNVTTAHPTAAELRGITIEINCEKLFKLHLWPINKSFSGMAISF